jgi:hypothetical protein
MSVSVNGTNGLTFNDGSTQNTSPFTGGFAMRNRIINGDMRIDQRNAGASVTANDGVFAVDRFKFSMTQSSKGTGQQSTTAPSGFINSLLFTSSSAYSVLSSDQFAIAQIIEGLNVADLAWGTASAATVTLSFWVRSSLTGTFGGAIQNSAANRSYPFSYTISAANTFEQKTITIPGDTSGTWLTTNGVGVRVFISLGMGSNSSGTAGAWSGSNFQSATGAVSVVGTNGATFYITGVQLEKGSTATSFDYRPYGTEEALCQNYCFKMAPTSNYGPYGMGHGVSTTEVRAFIKTAQTMRAQPTLSFSSASSFQLSFGNVLSSITAAEYGRDGFSVNCVTTGVSANGGYLLTSANNTTSYILATAEL